MKVLSIDIETFSSVNLQKCGVYKYAESEDFEILLFGYAVDGGAVQVVERDPLPVHATVEGAVHVDVHAPFRAQLNRLREPSVVATDGTRFQPGRFNIEASLKFGVRL